jgi:Cu-processing system permease protein
MAVFTITRLTFLEAARRRIALAAFSLGVAFLIMYAIAFYLVIHQTGLPSGSLQSELVRSQIVNFLSLMGLYAVQFLTIAMAALVAADTLAGEISSGTIQSLVTKPVRRAEVVAGKWLGYALLLALYLCLMIGGTVAIVAVVAGYSLPNVAVGALLIYVESLVIMSLTVACSSMFSTLATGGIVFGLWGLAFIGGFVEQIGALVHNTSVVNIGIISSLILPTEAVFRRAAWLMSTPATQALGGLANGPFFVVSVPSPAMVVYAFFYLVLLLGVAVRQFGRRDL